MINIDWPKYHAYVRKQGCIVCDKKAEAHHLFPAGKGRDKKKDIPEHLFMLPVCKEHHTGSTTSIHSLGAIKFGNKHDIEVFEYSARLLLNFLKSEMLTFKY